MSPCLLLLLAALPDPAAPPHGGLLARCGGGWLELVAGSGRLALFPLDERLVPSMSEGAEALIVPQVGPPLSLPRSGDHWELGRPPPSSVLVAVLRDRTGSRAIRFDVAAVAGSLYHDHRPFHGGMVGMAGQRHLELALSRGAEGAELQLFLTDAWRQPDSLAGVSGTVTVRGNTAASMYLLEDGGDCLVARIPEPHSTLDVHVTLSYPTAPQDVEMDFLLEPPRAAAPKSGEPVVVHVTSAGFSPNHIDARAGEPLLLRFLRTTDQTCATRVRFPAQGIDRELPLRRPVDVALVPQRGEIGFACGMGMLKGSVVAR